MAGLCHLSRPACSAATRLSLAPSRSFGAAALQYDYDYYYDEEEEASGGSWNDRLRLAPRADACSTTVGRGVQWVLMGSPGVQKHVYAARLSKLLEVPHISMGSLVRQELSPRSSLYKQIANAVNKGKLVPEEVIFGLLSKRLEEGYYQGETGFILDGIPRTRIQAEILDQIADIDLVVNFKCKEECSLKKELGAGLCSHCGESFNLSSTEFAGVSPCSHHLQLKSSVACTDVAHKEKLQFYTEQSKPLEDYYRKQRKLLDFQVAGEPGDAWHGLLAALRLQHMDIESTPKKMTA